jgi:protein subunit release factor B
MRCLRRKWRRSGERKGRQKNEGQKNFKPEKYFSVPHFSAEAFNLKEDFMLKIMDNGDSNAGEITLARLQGEVEITTYKSSGPGGQHKNKTETAVRLRHLPTGVTVTAREHRSQFKNREAAWERLLEKLRARQRKPKPRIATKPTRAAKEKRLQLKAARSAKKSERTKTRRWEEE